MTGQDCKRADLWLAALEAGDLDEDKRIRLRAHLDECESCQRRAVGLAGLVEILREDAPTLRRSRRAALWQEIEAARGTREHTVSIRQGRERRWHLAAAAAVAGLVLTAVVAYFLLQAGPQGAASDPAAIAADETTSESKPAAIPQRSRAAARATARQPAAARWTIASGAVRVLDGPEVQKRSVAPSDQLLEIRRQARFTSAIGSLLAAPETRLRFARSERSDEVEEECTIDLKHGRVVVLSDAHDGESCALWIVAGELRVHPLGTVFSVSRAVGGYVEVAVVEGRVEVVGPERTVNVTAGSRLRWGSGVEKLSEEERRLMLSADAAQVTPRASPADGPADESRAAAAASEQRHEPGQSGPRTPAWSEAPRQQPAGRAHPKPDIQSEILAIERLLSRGETTRARSQARELLAGAGGIEERHAAALSTLIAESLLKEGRYRPARDTYLDVWRRHAATAYGRDALFTAGSIELEQLQRPDRARKRFEAYLDKVPGGAQREGAHYLLYRSLQRLGLDQEASEQAAAYRREFPGGEYADRMPRPSSGGSRAPRPTAP